MRSLLFAICATMMTFASAVAGDWPQWLGLQRDGSTSEKVAPWTGDLKPLWKKSVSEGNSSPIVAGGLVFLHTKVKDKDVEMVQAFDAKTGDLKWEKSYEKTPFKPLFGEGPRATPCVADGKLFTYGNTGSLTCWNAATGEQLWQVDALKHFKEPNLFFGVSCSPVVIDDKVLVMTGKGTTGVAAFNVKDGSLAWKAGGDPASYSSPIVIGKGDARQIIFLTGAHVLAVSPKGDVLWKEPFKDALNESSTTPIFFNDLVIASSVKAGAVGLKLKQVDGKPAVEQAWKNPDLTCYFSTPISIDGEHVYMVTGVASLTGATITLRCVEAATGKEIWNKPKMGKFHAALLKMGDGKLLLHDDAGNLKLLAPNAKQYEELATAKVCGQTWAHPAIADGMLYVRDGKDLAAFKLADGR
jgi:outer membrane protein assembly factor BamB